MAATEVAVVAKVKRTKALEGSARAQVERQPMAGRRLETCLASSATTANSMAICLRIVPSLRRARLAGAAPVALPLPLVAPPPPRAKGVKAAEVKDAEKEGRATTQALMPARKGNA